MMGQISWEVSAVTVLPDQITQFRNIYQKYLDTLIDGDALVSDQNQNIHLTSRFIRSVNWKKRKGCLKKHVITA